MIRNLTDEQIEHRLKMVERMIATEGDHKSVPHHNKLFQMLIDEQARRDVERTASREN